MKDFIASIMIVAAMVMVPACATPPVGRPTQSAAPEDFLQTRIANVNFKDANLWDVVPFLAYAVINSSRPLPLNTWRDESAFGPRFTLKTNAVTIAEVLEEVVRQTQCVYVMTNNALFVGSTTNALRLAVTPPLRDPEEEDLTDRLNRKLTLFACMANPHDLLSYIMSEGGIPVDAMQTHIQPGLVTPAVNQMQWRDFIWWYTALCTDGTPSTRGEAIWIRTKKEPNQSIDSDEE